jgi:hypothetical protein
MILGYVLIAIVTPIILVFTIRVWLQPHQTEAYFLEILGNKTNDPFGLTRLTIWALQKGVWIWFARFVSLVIIGILILTAITLLANPIH